MRDLRPITLCKVCYRVISKVLTNRLKPLLGKVVSKNQSAFILRRLIIDNIFVSFEVLNYLKPKRSGKSGYMALKLDMSKAYNRVKWCFLKAIMEKMGFGRLWIERVMACVSTVR